MRADPSPGSRDAVVVIVPSLLPVCWPETSGNSIHGYRPINSGLLINKLNVSFIEDLHDKLI